MRESRGQSLGIVSIRHCNLLNIGSLFQIVKIIQVKLLVEDLGTVNEVKIGSLSMKMQDILP